MGGQAVQRGQFGEQIARQLAAAGADFQHVAAAGLQHLRHLPRQAVAKQRSNSGAVMKSPAAPNLAAPAL